MTKVSSMIDISSDEQLFGSRKYSQGQFTFVPDGDDLLIGTSYGTRRQFIARVPKAEVGQWLIEADLADKAEIQNLQLDFIEALPTEEIRGLKLEIDL